MATRTAAKKTKRRKAKPKAPRCIVTGCSNDQFRRGACQRCYRTVRTRIDSGELTEQEAIGAGLLNPQEKRGPKIEHSPAGRVLAQLAKKRK